MENEIEKISQMKSDDIENLYKEIIEGPEQILISKCDTGVTYADGSCRYVW